MDECKPLPLSSAGLAGNSAGWSNAAPHHAARQGPPLPTPVSGFRVYGLGSGFRPNTHRSRVSATASMLEVFIWSWVQLGEVGAVGWSWVGLGGVGWSWVGLGGVGWSWVELGELNYPHSRGIN